MNKCNEPSHPEYHGQECLCADCPVERCSTSPCPEDCKGPITQCDFPPEEEE